MLQDDDATWWNPKVLTVLLLVFVCGIAMGAAATRVFLHSRMDAAGQRHSMNLTRLKQQLNLTPDQERIVTKELDDYAKYYQNIEEERMDVAEQGKKRIFDVLTPDQQKKFDRLFLQLPH